jgi:hypothetical protein
MPQPEQEPPATAARPPRADGEVVAAAVALLEAAALTSAMRRVSSWNPHLHLSAAADRLGYRQLVAIKRAGWLRRRRSVAAWPRTGT